MQKKSDSKRLTGVVIPLGALYSSKNSAIGEFADLIPFANFCKNAGLKIIQLLPVNDTGTQSSPYSGLSAFALHPIYIRISDIPNFNEIYKADSIFKSHYDAFQKDFQHKTRYDYDGILNSKINLLRKLYEFSEVGKTGEENDEMKKWIKSNPWIKIYAVYKNLKWHYMQSSWKSWIENDKDMNIEQILKTWQKKAFRKEHLFYVWCQMIAEKQFLQAVDVIHKNGILLKGDMPILMNEDSCDTWAFSQFFNQDLRAGSPSDGDNPNGQDWGFPTYNWKNLKSEDYNWWKDRLKNASKYYDAYRLDHILGFFRIWAIPSSDCNALNGHTEPFSAIKKDSLYELGFDDDRIRWLSKPHIPTSAVEDITWNHELAHKILKQFCNQINNEELWLFKSEIKGSRQILEISLEKFCNSEIEGKIKQKLIEYWSNKTLNEISKNKYVPIWTYGNSTSWKTLNEKEKKSLLDLFDSIHQKDEKLWKKQANEIFEAISKPLNMIPCGEDLGVNIECVPKIMKKNEILGLRVVRWCREWEKSGKPYISFQNYEPLSVTTTSVHDSSTIRQWWNEEKSEKNDGKENEFCSVRELISEENQTFKNADFSPEIAFSIMKKCSETSSDWYICPLQDYLYMNKKYWLKNAEEERINVPGTVNKFNWTYRIPVSLEDLSNDKSLIEKIKIISER